MNKINVLHLISSLNTGGAEKLLLDTLEHSSRDSVEFTTVVMNDEIDPVMQEKLLAVCPHVYFLKRKQSNKNPKYLFELLNIIKSHKIQVIHSHNTGSKIWSILCKFLMPELKLVYTVHDTGIINKLSKLKLFLHQRFIDQNIAISKAVEKECIESNINNVVQIYNGINLKAFKQIEKQDNKIFKIINVARIDHFKKGQDLLIKALGLCKGQGMEFECLLVGNNTSDYTQKSYKYLQDLVKSSNLEEKIKFLGTRQDVPELLAGADLFVLPSRNEGLGLVVLEAMVSGVPVIASNIDGPAELIQNEGNGLLFETEDHVDLAEKIMFLYKNKEIKDKLRQKALQSVMDFDISKMCESYLTLYRDCLDAQ